MTLHVPNSGAMPDFAQAMAAQWEEAGIRVQIELEEENNYWVSKWLEVDLGVTWWGDRVAPQIYLDLAYRSDATWNESHWQDERLDELIDFARSALDQEARVAAYKEIQRMFLDEGSNYCAVFLRIIHGDGEPRLGRGAASFLGPYAFPHCCIGVDGRFFGRPDRSPRQGLSATGSCARAFFYPIPRPLPRSIREGERNLVDSAAICCLTQGLSLILYYFGVVLVCYT